MHEVSILSQPLSLKIRKQYCLPIFALSQTEKWPVTRKGRTFKITMKSLTQSNMDSLQNYRLLVEHLNRMSSKSDFCIKWEFCLSPFLKISTTEKTVTRNRGGHLNSLTQSNADSLQNDRLLVFWRLWNKGFRILVADKQPEMSIHWWAP